MGKLDGKVAVITGCAGGLGKQHAIRFAHEGAKLAICDILEERLMETQSESARVKEQKPELQEGIRQAFRDNPFQRAGNPYSDVSPVFVFLASDDSHWITGQNIHADGGGCITG